MADHPNLDDMHVVLARLLAWQHDMGVDAAIGDVTVDWLAPTVDGPARTPGQGFKISRSEASRPGAASASVSMPPPAAPAPTAKPPLPDRRPPLAAQPVHPIATPGSDTTPASARNRAATALDLDALRAEIERFDGCALKATAKSLCFYRGTPRARLMIIGEAPGREEDLAGKPFVGRAGQLLDRMLAAIGLTEADVHITNTVYWRPPGNRQPTPQETLVCRPFLDRQVDLVAPEFVLLMGGIAAGSMLDTTVGITRLRGRWATLPRSNGAALKALPTLHPAYLLRSPAAKRQAWQDLRLLKRALDGDN